MLPETDAAGAQKTAAKCREAITETRIPHETSACGQIVTISIGVGTIVPTAEDQPMRFIDVVDNIGRSRPGATRSSS